MPYPVSLDPRAKYRNTVSCDSRYFGKTATHI